MQNGTLSREHTLALLERLAKDDAFRAGFEKDPDAALRSIGVDDNTLSGLDAKGCRAPVRLAGKDVFQAELDRYRGSPEEFLKMITPQLRLADSAKG